MTSKRPSSNNPSSRGLRHELLENRTMMAGDVSAHIVEGNLVIEGDAMGNQIGIAAGIAPGVVVVGGLSSESGRPTTVNGQLGRVELTGFRGNVLVAMGEGDDSVAVPRLLVPGNFAIRMGIGNDHVRFGAAPTTPGDDPAVQVGVRGELAIGLGEGDDAVSLMGVRSTSIRVFGDGGADRIGIQGSQAARGILIAAGEGDDQVALGRVRASIVEIQTNGGNDDVRLTDSAFQSLAVNLGSGDDTLAIGHVSALRARLNGGDGDDTLTNLGDNRLGRLEVANFEHRGDGIEDRTNDSALV